MRPRLQLRGGGCAGAAARRARAVRHGDIRLPREHIPPANGVAVAGQSVHGGGMVNSGAAIVANKAQITESARWRSHEMLINGTS